MHPNHRCIFFGLVCKVFNLILPIYLCSAVQEQKGVIKSVSVCLIKSLNSCTRCIVQLSASLSREKNYFVYLFTTVSYKVNWTVNTYPSQIHLHSTSIVIVNHVRIQAINKIMELKVNWNLMWPSIWQCKAMICDVNDALKLISRT